MARFVLPRNRITLSADDTLGLGMPLERESQPLSLLHGLQRGGGFLGPRLCLEPELLLLFLHLRREGFIFQKGNLPPRFV